MPVRTLTQFNDPVTGIFRDNVTQAVHCGNLRDLVETVFDLDTKQTAARTGAPVIAGPVAPGPALPAGTAPNQVLEWVGAPGAEKWTPTALPTIPDDPHIVSTIATDLATPTNPLATAVKALIPVPDDPHIISTITTELANTGNPLAQAVDALIASQERFQGVAISSSSTPAPGTGEVRLNAIPAASAQNKGFYFLAGATVGNVGAGGISGKGVNAGDIIMSDGNTWSIIATGSSGLTMPSMKQLTDADAAMTPATDDVLTWDGSKWAAQPVPPEAVPAFDATATYATNDLVAQGGSIYKALGNVAAGAFNRNQWANIADSQQTPGVVEYEPADSYGAEDLVAFRGKIYAANKSTTGAFNPADWQDIAGSSAGIRWQANTPYAAGSIVESGGYLYRYDDWGKGNPLPGSAVFTAADWTPVGEMEGYNPAAGTTQGALYLAQGELLVGNVNGAAKPFDRSEFVQAAVPVFVPNVSYATGSYVFHQDKMWKARPGVAGGVWNSTQWTQVLPDPTAGGASVTAQAGAAPANAAADTTAPTGGNPLDIVIGEYHVWVQTPSGTWKKLLLDSPWGP